MERKIDSSVLFTRILEVLKNNLEKYMTKDADVKTKTATFEGYDVKQIYEDFEALKIIIKNNVDMGMVRISVDVDNYNLWATKDLLAEYLTEEEYKLIKRKCCEYER